MAYPKEIQELNDALNSLPGVGPRLSSRLALYLSVNAKELSRRISTSLLKVIENIKSCSKCGNVSSSDLCDICENTQRNPKLVFVVEDPIDLANIESTKEFNGLYHVLGGVISPMNGIGPDELNIQKLLNRVKEDGVEEIIFGLNSNMEGDSTCLYIKNELERNPEISDVKVSRLAKGIPAGGDIEYLSGQTIKDSLKRRVDL